MVALSDYFVSTQLQLWLFCCWGCGCCWAMTICTEIGVCFARHYYLVYLLELLFNAHILHHLHALLILCCANCSKSFTLSRIDCSISLYYNPKPSIRPAICFQHPSLFKVCYLRYYSLAITSTLFGSVLL